jgi:hypothetical protein
VQSVVNRPYRGIKVRDGILVREKLARIAVCVDEHIARATHEFSAIGPADGLA